MPTVEDKSPFLTHQLLGYTLKKRLEEAAGEKLQGVIIYGSRAWGHPDPDSDLDVAAIVQDCTPQMEGPSWRRPIRSCEIAILLRLFP